MTGDRDLAPMLTIEQVAILLNVHANTVRRWCNQGALKTYRIGLRGDRRFLRQDVTDFLTHKSDEPRSLKESSPSIEPVLANGGEHRPFGATNGSSEGETTRSLAIASLTKRETEILRYVSQGNANRRIGETLGITERTVKSHVGSIVRKLHANDRAHAVALALRSGWIPMETKGSEA